MPHVGNLPSCPEQPEQPAPNRPALVLLTPQPAVPQPQVPTIPVQPSSGRASALKGRVHLVLAILALLLFLELAGVSWEELGKFPLEKISVLGAGGLALLRKQVEPWLVRRRFLVRALFACALLLNLPIYGTTILVNPKDSTIRPVSADLAGKTAAADADAAKADAQGERISPRILWLRLRAQRYKIKAEAPFDEKDITISGRQTLASLWGAFPVRVDLDAKYEIIGPNGYDIYVDALGHEPHWKSDQYATIVTLTSGCHQIWIRTDKGETGCHTVRVPQTIPPINIDVGDRCGGC